MRSLLQQLAALFKNRNPGLVGAGIGLVLAMLLVIFGFFKTLFILLMTLGGYFLGVRFFSDRETVRNWMDKLLPPGKFR